MLFTLGLLLLLTPFPSIQTTTNEKRDSTGSDVTKASAAFTRSKPKTTALPDKQTNQLTLKPNAISQTVLPTPATKQKSPTANVTLTTKGRHSPTVIQTTPSVVKATTPRSTLSNKDKHTVPVNQTKSPKSASGGEVKGSKDKHSPTGILNVQPTPTKTASSSGAKPTKHKLQPSGNQTILIRSPSTDHGNTAKDRPATTVVQNTQSTFIKSTAATKNKPAPSVNQTVVARSPTINDVKSKGKPSPTKVPTVLPLETPAKTTDKEKVTTSANDTVLIKESSKDKPASSQPIKVIISEGCDSSNTKEQELKLKPGAPLVMTHKISLLPGGCSGECEAEMAELKGRVARLEREMSFLKDKCIIFL